MTGAGKHTVDYLDAWIERTAINGGIVPSNIGLDGTIGGECDGKWWGGVYGWGFSCIDIHDLPTDTPALELEKQGKATRVWRCAAFFLLFKTHLSFSLCGFAVNFWNFWLCVQGSWAELRLRLPWRLCERSAADGRSEVPVPVNISVTS